MADLFGELTRKLAGTTSRRQAIKVFAAGVAGGLASLVNPVKAFADAPFSVPPCGHVGARCGGEHRCCGGEFCDPDTGMCRCSPDYSYCGTTNTCVGCGPGQTFDSNTTYTTCECICDRGRGYFLCPSTNACIQCPYGQTLDTNTCACVCDTQNLSFPCPSSGQCVQCGPGQTIDSSTCKCVCNTGQDYTIDCGGKECCNPSSACCTPVSSFGPYCSTTYNYPPNGGTFLCPSNGTCVRCRNGTVFNSDTCRCECQPGGIPCGDSLTCCFPNDATNPTCCFTDVYGHSNCYPTSQVPVCVPVPFP